MTDNELPRPPWDEELDAWYAIDEKTRHITFRKEHPTYKMMRSDFLALGYDIDACKTAYDIRTIRRRHIDFFAQMNDARIAAIVPNNLEEKLLKAIFNDDDKEQARLLKLLKKRKAIGLKCIK